jgi:hypothetical protein
LEQELEGAEKPRLCGDGMPKSCGEYGRSALAWLFKLEKYSPEH